MGSFKSKNHKVDINVLPVIEPEPDYVIKTRQPMPTSWRLNILRGKREDELKGLAYAYSRRKCHKYVYDFIECERREGAFWAAFECQCENHDMQECMEHELNVEMDKLRRNMKLNTEWWWRDLYDENGEVGEQAKWRDEYFAITKIRNYFDKIRGGLSA